MVRAVTLTENKQVNMNLNEGDEEEQEMETVVEDDIPGQDDQSQPNTQPGRKTNKQPAKITGATSKKKQPTVPCLCCGENCGKQQLAVKCVLCTLWAHKTCIRMDDATYKHLDQQFRETGMAYWVCRPCQTFSQRVKHQFQENDKRHTETKKRVDSNTARLDTCHTEIEEMKKAMQQMAERMDMEQDRRDSMVCEEMQEREIRRKNIVLHGLAEAPENIRVNRERMEWDRKKCCELFHIMGARLKLEDIRFCRRVGERRGEPRPLIVGLFRDEDKEHTLGRARHLHGTAFEKVSVVPDLTKKQRALEIKLKEEAEEKNKYLTAEDLRNNLRWIVVGRRGEKRIIKGVERDQENYNRGNNWRQSKEQQNGGPQNWQPNGPANEPPSRQQPFVSQPMGQAAWSENWRRLGQPGCQAAPLPHSGPGQMNSWWNIGPGNGNRGHSNHQGSYNNGRTTYTHNGGTASGGNNSNYNSNYSGNYNGNYNQGNGNENGQNDNTRHGVNQGQENYNGGVMDRQVTSWCQNEEEFTQRPRLGSKRLRNTAEDQETEERQAGPPAKRP